MFAHKVIDDLQKFWMLRPNKKFILNEKDRSRFIELSEEAASLIEKESVKFHLGDLNYENTYNLYSFKGRKKLFSEDSNLYKTPFDVCYFDYFFNSNLHKMKKVAMLTVKVDIEGTKDNIFIYIFRFYDNKNSINWEFSGNVWLFNNNGFFLLESIFNEDNDKDIGVLAVLEKTLMFLNCKNIGTKTINAPEKLNKKRKKAGKKPIYSYKTLIIKPTLKNEKSIPKHLWENRIHLARGHFKTYTKDNPLFGKHTGMYWWQPQVRGNKKGIIHKDYKIEY